jgi:hypothetical protein
MCPEAFLDYWSLRKVRLQMPPRSRRPHLSAEKPPVFEDLAPSLRDTALKMCEGNTARIRVLSSSKFEVLTEAELVRESPAEPTEEVKPRRSRKRRTV